jgi:hypothetical protein
MMQAKHILATIHRHKIPPSQALVDAGDLIWVMPVTPEPDPSHPALRDGVNANVQDYYRCNEVNRFVSERPYRREVNGNEVKGAGEGIMFWIERAIYTSESDRRRVLTASARATPGCAGPVGRGGCDV